MTLGIFLSMGGSFKDMAEAGQDELFKKFYLSYFAENFDKVYIFSYENEKERDLPKNVYLIPNRYKLHRYIYSLLIPLINSSYISKCDVFRAYHLYGTVPAIISRIFFQKPFIFNWAYDYKKFAQIEKKFLQFILIFFLKPVAETFASKIFRVDRQYCAKDKDIYLPNGVDTNFFKPMKVKKNKTPLILSVGRLERQKNYENLIRALKGLRANLLLVGSGSLKNKLIKIAKKEDINLKIIERIENTKMPHIYNRADIFILPSVIEGSPKALLEAMSCKLPVIGTKVDGIKNIILDGKNGLLVENDNHNINLAIKRLIGDRKLKEKLAEGARAFVKRYHNLKFLIKLEIEAIKNINT